MKDILLMALLSIIGAATLAAIFYAMLGEIFI